jgi:hypothetical protein
MLRDSKVTDDEVAARLRPRQNMTPPTLPPVWTSSLLLHAFGDADPTMSDYDQVIVGTVQYDETGAEPAMRVSLYLLEAMLYFDFLFTSGQWYWLVSTPGAAPTAYFGPFATSLQVRNVLAQGATYANSWNIAGTPTDGWVIPTTLPPNSQVPPHGTWYSVRSDTGGLWRVLNLDNDNPVQVPVLGSYYLAYLPGFTATEPLNLLGLIAGIPQNAGNPPSPMVSQRDIQQALANPLAWAQCTLEQIQAVLPGISFPSTQPPLPAWTDQTFIQGWTIGCDPIPYWTQVWYWWSNKTQRSSFVGYGFEAGTGNYRQRQDNVLYADYFTNPQYYAVDEHQWLLAQCAPGLQGVGLPRPDFVAADGGVVKATIVGNASFGLGPNDELQLIRVSMPRGPNGNGVDVTSVFWFWFTADQKGVLFSEGNFIDTVTAHDLQVIDYDYFEQNASDNVNANSFPDPCNTQSGTSAWTVPSAGMMVRHPGF